MKSDELFLHLTAAILAKCVVTMQNIVLPCSGSVLVTFLHELSHHITLRLVGRVWGAEFVEIFANGSVKWAREWSSFLPSCLHENRSLKSNGVCVGVLMKRTSIIFAICVRSFKNKNEKWSPEQGKKHLEHCAQKYVQRICVALHEKLAQLPRKFSLSLPRPSPIGVSACVCVTVPSKFHLILFFSFLLNWTRCRFSKPYVFKRIISF